MTLQQLLTNVATMCNLPLTATDFDQTPTHPTVERLVLSANIVAENIFRTLLPRKTTVVTPQNGVIDISALDVMQVVACLDENGAQLPFHHVDGAIVVRASDTPKNLVYVCLPPILTLTDVLPQPLPSITDKVYLVGVAGQYFNIIGDYALAQTYLKQYHNLLSKCALNNKRLPCRRWC